jgi:hypothetical protein
LVLAQEESSARELLAALRLRSLRRLRNLVVGADIMVVVLQSQTLSQVETVLSHYLVVCLVTEL